jgi:mono/diheme cytochrome c family protein/Tol biopolymer transport system component
MRAWLLVALVASVIAVAALIVWLAGRDAAAPAVRISQTAQVAGMQIIMQLDQAVLGPRVVELTVQDAAGAPVDLSAVRLRFTMVEMDMGRIEADAQPLGQGRYQARGAFFTMAGRWDVSATIERAGQPPVQAAFAFAIAAPGEAAGPLNPLTADSATLAAGRQLYAANCVACHGATGRGDGPAAVGLRPQPADFMEHMTPGKHTDGQVFLWIKNGYPGTAMPAWGGRLSDDEIWRIVVYLRTFGQPTVATAGAQPTAQSPAATSSPGARELLPPLVFVRQGNLWRSDGSGAAPRRLTSLGAEIFAEHPAVSPEGGRVAFVARSPGPLTATLPVSITTLYVMNADGSGLRALWRPSRGWLALPAWAPDGQALYVGSSDLRSDPRAPVSDWLFEIVRVDVATGERRQALADGRDPVITRDGALMAYLRYDKANAAFSLHAAVPDGSGDREVIAAGAFAAFYAPRFSPDGTRIVVAAIGGPVTDERGYPISGSAASPLGALLDIFEPPTAEAHGAPWDVWVVNVDGTGLRRLPLAREDTPMAVFAPDGRQIVMMGAGGIYLMDADGGNFRQIDPLGDHGGLDWAPK